MGITSVKAIDYIGAHIGMLPDVAMYCFIGASINELVDIAETGIGDSIPFLIVLGVTLCLSIIGIVTISYFAKQKFDKMVNNLNSGHNANNKDDDDHTVMSEMQIVSVR